LSFGSAIALVQKFSTRIGGGAFPNLGVSRSAFALDLMNRINSPSLLDQRVTSLCGPAVFLYSVLCKDPEVFAQYVIDLYETGQAKIGSLVVKPGSDCRNYAVVARKIAPVDWVALASLRDGSNALLDYDEPSVAAGGITLPSAVAGWFRSAGFKSVTNRTNIYFDSDLWTLLQANTERGAGAAVCLFVGSNLFSGTPGGTAIPDHWVALTSAVRIDGVSTASLLARGASAVNGDKNLAATGIGFDVFTWGDPGYPARRNRPTLSVETCIDYFYGYVSAK
jgi:hypothetical protein